MLRSPRLNLIRLLPRNISRYPASTLFLQSHVTPRVQVYPGLRRQHQCFSTSYSQLEQPAVEPLADVLPVCCPGCGAFSQTVEANEPGYYGTSRKSIRKLLAVRKGAIESNIEDANKEVSGEDGVAGEQKESLEDAAPPKPMQGEIYSISFEGAMLTEPQRRCLSR